MFPLVENETFLPLQQQVDSEKLFYQLEFRALCKVYDENLGEFDKTKLNNGIFFFGFRRQINTSKQ